MSRVLVTGSEGFIGRALVQRLLRDGLGGEPVEHLTLVDLAFAAAPAQSSTECRVQQLWGSVADASVRAAALSSAPDVIFHLASVPGGAAERDPDLGRRVNLDATLALVDACQALAAPARFIYASSVAVYGEDLPDGMNEDTLPAPALSYGAHKLACEILIADASRRGWIQGCSLRLPGVVARPDDGSAGLISAFMSQVFWRLSQGEQITLPVSPNGTCWWISVGTCVSNFLHAATMDTALWSSRRSYQMPVVHLGIAQVVQALIARFGGSEDALVRYVPNPMADRLFASYPSIHTPVASELGWVHDGDVNGLIENALRSV